jgi:Arc/MetJ family transcription regulator
MRTTLTLDDDLMARASEYTGLTESGAIVREALKALVSREAARRLAALGGTMPDFEPAPRKRHFEPHGQG